MSLKIKAFLIRIGCYCTIGNTGRGSRDRRTLKVDFANDPRRSLARLLRCKDVPIDHSQDSHLAHAQFFGCLVQIELAALRALAVRSVSMTLRHLVTLI